MIEISPFLRAMSVRLFARTGEHCLTLKLVLGERPVPRDLQDECGRERASFLADPNEWYRAHGYGPRFEDLDP